VDQAVAGEEHERDDDEEGGERAVGDIFTENKDIYCNKLPNLDRLDALEGIEHDDNEYSEHLEGIIVESEEGRESVVNKDCQAGFLVLVL
jgi:hypothetical protein